MYLEEKKEDANRKHYVSTTTRRFVVSVWYKLSLYIPLASRSCRCRYQSHVPVMYRRANRAILLDSPHMRRTRGSRAIGSHRANAGPCLRVSHLMRSDHPRIHSWSVNIVFFNTSKESITVLYVIIIFDK